MDNCKIQINKTYVTKSFGSKPWLQVNHRDVHSLVGLCEEDTAEYYLGYRFFSDKGIFYRQDGSCSTGSPDDSLMREATVDNLKGGYIETLRLDLEHSVPSTWVPVTDPAFIMSLGGIYINRMGFVHMVREVLRYERSDHPNGESVHFISTPNQVNGVGGWSREPKKPTKTDHLPIGSLASEFLSSYNDLPRKSMEDFIYQRL